MLDFQTGLKYPWGKPKRLFYILWILIPIIGWLALIGYAKKIINMIVKGKTKELPEFGSFADNLTKGFMIIIMLIPLLIVFFLISYIPQIGITLTILFGLFLVPWLFINLMEKYTVAATFEWGEAVNVVFGNFSDYVVTLIKSIGYSIIYGLLSLILVGIPCQFFGKNIFFADFYARYSKKKPAKKKKTKKKKKKKK